MAALSSHTQPCCASYLAVPTEKSIRRILRLVCEFRNLVQGHHLVCFCSMGLARLDGFPRFKIGQCDTWYGRSGTRRQVGLPSDRLVFVGYGPSAIPAPGRVPLTQLRGDGCSGPSAVVGSYMVFSEFDWSRSRVSFVVLGMARCPVSSHVYLF